MPATILRTDRLVLRRARPDDLEAMHAILSNPLAMRYWSTTAHADIEQTRAWLGAMIDSPEALSDDFVVTLDGALIGKAGFWRLPEIGYILHPDHWGKGYAQEALRAAIAHVFARPEVSEVTADVDPRNEASLRLLSRLGFAETGRKARTWLIDGAWCDSVYLALRRPTTRPA